MHLPSAAEMKGTSRRLKQDKPKEGTVMRDLYDRFADNPGMLIPINASSWPQSYFTQLQNTYGLEIRKVKNPGYRGGPGLYYLTKFWNGKDYTDLTSLLTKDTPILGQEDQT